MRKKSAAIFGLAFMSLSVFFPEDAKPQSVDIRICEETKQKPTTQCPDISIEGPAGFTRGKGGQLVTTGGKIECSSDGPCPKAVQLLVSQNTFRVQIIQHRLWLLIKNKTHNKEILLELGLTDKGEYELIKKTKSDPEKTFKLFIEKQNLKNTEEVTITLLQGISFRICS